MKKNVVTADEKTLASTFNKHYINIVEISSGKTPKYISKLSHGKNKQEVPCDISNAYKNHLSLKQMENKFIRQNFFGKEIFFC